MEQRHGKARVRVGRVWRQGGDGSHHFVEWNVSISLLSHCLSSYHRDDNSDIVATDTMKNTVCPSKTKKKKDKSFDVCITSSYCNETTCLAVDICSCSCPVSWESTTFCLFDWYVSNLPLVSVMFLNEKVYVKAKECGDRLSVEEFAILLGNHFCSFYPQVYISSSVIHSACYSLKACVCTHLCFLVYCYKVYTAIVNIIEKPWERVCIDGKPHLHGRFCGSSFGTSFALVWLSFSIKVFALFKGFKLGSENHTVEATVQKSGALTLTSGVAGLALLKTTQVHSILFFFWFFCLWLAS